MKGWYDDFSDLKSKLSKIASTADLIKACDGIVGPSIIKSLSKKAGNNLDAAKKIINDYLDSNIDYANSEISEMEQKIKDYDSVVKSILSILKSGGYSTKRNGENILVYPKGEEDTYNLMHDLKDLLFKNSAKDNMGMFAPSRGSAWTALEVKMKSIKFKIDCRSSKDKKAVEIDFSNI